MIEGRTPWDVFRDVGFDSFEWGGCGCFTG